MISQEMNNQEISNKKFNFIPWIFVLFFVVFILVDIFYIYMAQKTWQGIATEDGYQKGLHYNQTIEYVKRQRELGWSSKINYFKVAPQSGDLNFTLTDKSRLTISNAKVVAVITRPVQSGYDFAVNLQFNQKKSFYSSRINFPLPGQWNIEIQAIRGSDTYQEVKRLIIQ